MLEYELTPHSAGVVLWDDPWSLRSLHDFIHRVNEHSALIENKNGVVFALAGDLGQALRGARRKSWRRKRDDRYLIYGAEILWPTLLVQIAVLRESLAYMPTTRHDQARMYDLESIIDDAITAAMPGHNERILEQMQRIGAAHTQAEEALNSRCCYYVSLPAEQRLRMLPRVLTTLEPLYPTLAQSGKLDDGPNGYIDPRIFDDLRGRQRRLRFEW